MVDLVEEILDVMLMESLDSPLEIVKGQSKFHEPGTTEKTLMKNGAGSVTVYHTVDFEPEIEFYTFLYKGKWEVHFNNVTEGFNVGKIAQYDRSTTMAILSTVVQLYKEKIDKGQGLRVYTPIPELQSIMIRYMQRTLPKDTYTFQKIEDFKTVTGNSVPVAYEIVRDNRTVRLTQENYIEDINEIL